MDRQQGQGFQELNARLEKELAEKSVELLRKNREIEIERALEKVRARTMGMRTSAELSETSTVLFHQIKELGINVIRTGVGIFDDANDAMEIWLTTFSESQEVIRILDYVNLHIHPVFENIIPARQQKKPFSITVLTGDEVRQYYRTMSTYTSVPGRQTFNPKEFFYSFFFDEGSINVIAYQPLTDEECAIMVRVAHMFGMIYTRFLDLQRAEMQTREARIEASLERVRGKAMAMHSSDDLAATIGVFYKELESLNISTIQGGVGLIARESRLCELSTMSTTREGPVEVIGTIKLSGHPVLEGVYDHWLAQEEYHPVLRGNEIKEYNQIVRPQVSFPDLNQEDIQYGYFFFFPEGGVYAFTDLDLGEDELKIFRKFTSVLSLTYKRYKDLVEAEARAHQAVREASLDRVRAQIASMRNAEDLQRITPLIWRELKALGVPFFRCGVLIVNEKEGKLDYYLSTPEGRPLAALHLGFDSADITKNAIHHWRQQSVYTDHWDREQFTAFTESMIEQGQIQTASTYQGGEEPPESLTLQFMPFTQGMLYIGSAEPLSTAQLELAQDLTEAFSTAYARYEDFVKLEAAIVQVENTLKDLRETQKQLIQSEKMASLGELTAGIAHEIQNPLNFVNNFSEVSNELLEEMETEISKGNTEAAKSIAKDVKQNLEKILHHGKRADSIVKGMLQHSRTSSGQKEPTDINVLADEYLRLAYHGLRAKDKSFNAVLKTDFDNTIAPINALTQDIGRVMLNLLTNAFYAVTEKRKQLEELPTGKAGYEPTVSIITRKAGNRVEIRVSDNGNGIPQKVLDKIFQPFFTTKPTGQGTGLGLSMSYDIITKGHGGELIVETQEGIGTSFIIRLPA